MGITYNAGTNTITVTGTYSGNLFSSIYAADVAGGWGVWFNQGTNQHYTTAKLLIGDGSTATTVSQTNASLIWSAGFAGNTNILYGNKASITFGALLDATSKTTSSGVDFMCLTNANTAMTFTTDSTVYLYNCTIKHPLSREIFLYTHVDRIWNCTFDKTCIRNFSNTEIYNLNTYQPYNDGTINQPTTGNTFDKISVSSSVNVIVGDFANTDKTVSNLHVRNCTYIFRPSNVGSYNWYFIDVDSDTWAFNWVSSQDGRVYRQYTFNLEVYDASGAAINGAAVLLEQQDGTDVVDTTTNASGAIAEQTVSRGYYVSAAGDTLQDYGPFKLTVSKAGYMPYVLNGIVLDEPIDWRIYLRTQLSGDADAADVATGKKFYADDADTKLTGTYTPTQLMEQRTKIRRVENPVDELLLMYTGMLTIENQKLRRNRIEPKPS